MQTSQSCLNYLHWKCSSDGSCILCRYGIGGRVAGNIIGRAQITMCFIRESSYDKKKKKKKKGFLGCNHVSAADSMHFVSFTVHCCLLLALLPAALVPTLDEPSNNTTKICVKLNFNCLFTPDLMAFFCFCFFFSVLFLSFGGVGMRQPVK